MFDARFITLMATIQCSLTKIKIFIQSIYLAISPAIGVQSIEART